MAPCQLLNFGLSQAPSKTAARAGSFCGVAEVRVPRLARRGLHVCCAEGSSGAALSLARRWVVQALLAVASSPDSRQPWDVGRFLKTVVYFNDPAKALQELASAPARLLSSFPGQQQQQTSSRAVLGSMTSATSAPIKGVVLVAGATGGVGKRVVAELLQHGFKVRALVRDAAKAEQMLAGVPASPEAGLEIATADITQPSTLLPEYVKGVRALVVCTAAKVDAEGDTPDRQRYYQGIQFYNPSITENTPEAVELRGVQNVVSAALQSLGQAQGLTLFDAAGQGSARVWGPLDDVVMGGVSESGFELRQQGGESGGPVGVFSGIVSAANSGGFASVRTRNFDPQLDLGAYGSLQLRVRGNGLRFKCIIRTDTNWDGIAYCSSFDTQDSQWQTVELPFSSFRPTFRSKSAPDAPPLNPSSVVSIQLMLSKFEYDGELNPHFRTGAFSLPLHSISASMGRPLAPRIVHVSSAGVTRPNRPGINKDQEPPAVKLNEQLGGLLTYKLAGEDVVRGSGTPFSIVRPCALTEEPAGAELVLDQGDTIRGKVSREDIAQLCVALLSQPAALDTTFEIKSTVPFSEPFTGTGNGKAGRDWAALIKTASLQSGVTGKTVNGQYTGKQVERDALAPALASSGTQ